MRNLSDKGLFMAETSPFPLQCINSRLTQGRIYCLVFAWFARLPASVDSADFESLSPPPLPPYSSPRLLAILLYLTCLFAVFPSIYTFNYKQKTFYTEPSLELNSPYLKSSPRRSSRVIRLKPGDGFQPISRAQFVLGSHPRYH